MFQKNNLEFQGGLLPLSDLLVSDSSVPNVQQTKQETYYPSINDPNFYNSIYQQKPVDNLNNYYQSYTLAENQVNNPEKVETFDQSKRITMFQTKNYNQTNKEINQKENITIKNNEVAATQKSQSQPMIEVEKNINSNPENIVLRSAPKSLKKNKIEKKTNVINDNDKNINVNDKNINDNDKHINDDDKNNNNKNNNLVNEKKFALKYLLLKKETKLKSLLKMSFGKYNKNVIEQKVKANTENSQNLITNENKEKKENKENKENNGNNEDLKIKKLRDIVRKKISKNREKMHIILIKYYYSSLYIHLNWYMYVVNQLTYQQSMNPTYQASYYGTAANNQVTSNTNDNNDTEDPDPFKDIPPAEDPNAKHNSEVNDAFRESVMRISKMNNTNNMEEAFRESMMTINRINDALNNEEKEKKKLEKKKHLKDLVTKRLKEIKNDFHKMFTKFYYQGLLVEKMKKQNEESNADGNNEGQNEGAPTRLRAKKNPALERRNKARNLRKLMAKKEKEKIDTLRKYFSKFYTNGLLCKLKKNAKYSQSTKNVTFNMDATFYNEEENKEQEQELTLLDKKRIEEKKKKEELDLKRISALKIIFFKKDRNITIIKKKTIEKWNLRAKIMSLQGLKKGKKRDLAKSMRVKKKKSKATKGDLDFKKGTKSQIIFDKVEDDDENQDNKI